MQSLIADLYDESQRILSACTQRLHAAVLVQQTANDAPEASIAAVDATTNQAQEDASSKESTAHEEFVSDAPGSVEIKPSSPIIDATPQQQHDDEDNKANQESTDIVAPSQHIDTKEVATEPAQEPPSVVNQPDQPAENSTQPQEQQQQQEEKRPIFALNFSDSEESDQDDDDDDDFDQVFGEQMVTESEPAVVAKEAQHSDASLASSSNEASAEPASSVKAEQATQKADTSSLPDAPCFQLTASDDDTTSSSASFQPTTNQQPMMTLAVPGEPVAEAVEAKEVVAVESSATPLYPSVDQQQQHQQLINTQFTSNFSHAVEAAATTTTSTMSSDDDDELNMLFGGASDCNAATSDPLDFNFMLVDGEQAHTAPPRPPSLPSFPTLPDEQSLSSASYQTPPLQSSLYQQQQSTASSNLFDENFFSDITALLTNDYDEQSLIATANTTTSAHAQQQAQYDNTTNTTASLFNLDDFPMADANATTTGALIPIQTHDASVELVALEATSESALATRLASGTHFLDAAAVAPSPLKSQHKQFQIHPSPQQAATTTLDSSTVRSKTSSITITRMGRGASSLGLVTDNENKVTPSTTEKRLLPWEVKTKDSKSKLLFLLRFASEISKSSSF